jgi:hypothetical protein
LQPRRLKRAGEADIVRGDQVGNRPDERRSNRNGGGDGKEDEHRAAMGAPKWGRSRHHGTTVRLSTISWCSFLAVVIGARR